VSTSFQWLNPEGDDFRQKVMQAIELDGLKKIEASQVFNISRNTINLWCQRQAKTGYVKPKARQASQQKGKINDWDKFRAFVKEHGDKTQTEKLVSARFLGHYGRLDIPGKKNIRVLPTG
jgi:transposase